MNLSKELKKKRDAEDRLRNSSPQVVFVDSGITQTFDNYATKADLAGKADADHTHEITELTDVLITYTDNAGKFLKVNSTEDGIDLGEVSGGGGASAFTDLTDAPSAYTDMAGKVVKVNSTEDGLEFGDGGGISEIPQATDTTIGGVKAKDRTTESAEVAIDTATGKLYTLAPDEAANGLPAGGTIGQIPIKNSEDDYDYSWGDAPSGGGSEEGSAWKNGVSERRFLILATASGGYSGDPMNMLGSVPASGFYWANGSATKTLIYEFLEANCLTGIAFIQNNNTAMGIWTIAGSQDGEIWEDIIDDYVWGGTPYGPYFQPPFNIYAREFENEKQFKYYKLTLNEGSSTSNSPYQQQVLFKCEPV